MSKKLVGEADRRRKGLERGGQPLATRFEGGELRGMTEDGEHTTGMHGGPSKHGKTGAHGPDRPRR